MPFCLIMHDLSPVGVEALQSALWEVAESHWAPTPGSFAVATGVSVDYLCSHLAGAVRRAGEEGPILVVEAGRRAAARGLPDTGETWLHDQIQEYHQPADA